MPYWNLRIITVIHKLYFIGGARLFAGCFKYIFPSNQGLDGMVAYEVLVPMVALVAIAVSLF
jgi:hypothetical protein